MDPVVDQMRQNQNHTERLPVAGLVAGWENSASITAISKHISVFRNRTSTQFSVAVVDTI